LCRVSMYETLMLRLIPGAQPLPNKAR
jgi:hypothetical protein